MTDQDSFLNNSLNNSLDFSFLASEYPNQKREHARFWIIPVPLEKSVSYGSGTACGPSAVLAASQQLEAWEEGFKPGKEGFYTSSAVDCSSDMETVLARIEEQVRAALELGAVPVLLGGEHSLTLGALRAYAHTSEGELPGIVQIDAHADLRPEYEGNPYSHACVMYRAVHDLGYRLAQFAVREFCPQEAEIRAAMHIVHHDAGEIADKGLPEPVLPVDFPRDVYVTFDVDGFDCSLMPATGTPSPGGLFWHDARRLLGRIAESRRIVGLDVVELAPIPGLHSADFIAAKLTHLLMGLSSYSSSRFCSQRS